MLQRSLRTGTWWRWICCPSCKNWSRETNTCSSLSTSATTRSFNILVTLFRLGEPIPVRIHPWWQNTSQYKCSMDLDPRRPHVFVFTPWFASIDRNSSTPLVSKQLALSKGFVLWTRVTGTPRSRPEARASLLEAVEVKSSKYKRDTGFWSFWSKSPQHGFPKAQIRQKAHFSNSQTDSGFQMPTSSNSSVVGFGGSWGLQLIGIKKLSPVSTFLEKSQALQVWPTAIKLCL